jgi:hypothetical protein
MSRTTRKKAREGTSGHERKCRPSGEGKGVNNNGDSSQTVIHNASEDYKLATNTWYHVGVTYDDSDKSYRIRLYDGSSESVSHKTGTTTNNINVEDGPATVGRFYGSDGYWDGLIDQIREGADTARPKRRLGRGDFSCGPVY